MSAPFRTKQVNFRISEDRYNELKARADEQGKTISLYLNDLVNADLNFSKQIVMSEKEGLEEIMRKLDSIERYLYSR